MTHKDREKQWDTRVDTAKRSMSPGGIPSVRPANEKQLGDLIDVVGELGRQNLRLIEEMRKQRRLLTSALALVLASFVGGAILQRRMAEEQAEQRELDRIALARAVVAAKTELAGDVSRTMQKVDESAELAKQGVREALGCQIEAVDVKARIAPPKERKELREMIEEKRREVRKLGGSLK